MSVDYGRNSLTFCDTPEFNYKLFSVLLIINRGVKGRDVGVRRGRSGAVVPKIDYEFLLLGP